MSHTYLMQVYRYFGGYEEFTIEAENKSDALRLGKIYVLQNPKYDSNYDKNDVKVVKKMKPKKVK